MAVTAAVVVVVVVVVTITVLTFYDNGDHRHDHHDYNDHDHVRFSNCVSFCGCGSCCDNSYNINGDSGNGGSCRHVYSSDYGSDRGSGGRDDYDVYSNDDVAVEVMTHMVAVVSFTLVEMVNSLSVHVRA